MSLEVSNNNQDYTSDEIPFVYQANSSVQYLNFTRGVAMGGTLIDIVGTNFVNTTLLRCKFNSTDVQATWSSSTHVRCISPAHAVGVVGVDVTNNNQDYTTDAVKFEYFRMSTNSFPC